MNNKSILVMMASLLLATSICSAEVVFNWQENGVNKYSDTPKNLSTNGVDSIDTRTHISKPASVATDEEEWNNLSLEEQQIRLNAKIVAENKKIAQDNADREKTVKAENCKTAKLNLDTAQSSFRLQNKEQLLTKYQTDIDKYCN